MLLGNPSKDTLLIEFVQLGIDCAGVADNGGGWPNNGGNGSGRKLPILFAGLLLNDARMKQVGTWKTRFQEDEQTFYVSQADVEPTHSNRWRPDVRQNTPTPYETKDIGLAEWAWAAASGRLRLLAPMPVGMCPTVPSTAPIIPAWCWPRTSWASSRPGITRPCSTTPIGG